jgi:hypothetical protein
MDTYYRQKINRNDDQSFQKPLELNHNFESNEQILKRVSIEPEEEMKKLEKYEIGIKSGLKGSEIKEYVDRAIYKIINQNHGRVILKAIGIACSKVLSISDILKRKVKGLQEIHKNYSRKYVAKYESEDVKYNKFILRET